MFFGDFENFTFPLTKWLSYNFHTWKLYDKHFLSKTSNQFFCWPESFKRGKQTKNVHQNFLKHFLICVWFLYDKNFFHRLDIWNCKISIFLLWTSTLVLPNFWPHRWPWAVRLVKKLYNFKLIDFWTLFFLRVDIIDKLKFDFEMNSFRLINFIQARWTKRILLTMWH